MRLKVTLTNSDVFVKDTFKGKISNQRSFHRVNILILHSVWVYSESVQNENLATFYYDRDEFNVVNLFT